MNEQELNNVNQIDLDCKYVDDDDLIISDVPTSDDREVQSKTGIIITFDDDEDYRPTKTILADTSSKSTDINISSDDFSLDDIKDYNIIDMETKYSEDDDEELSLSSAKKNPLFFDSDDALCGLISEDMIDEGKKSTTFGEVEDDYWDKVSQKHKQSNKKGAYNTHMHFAGNPKKEQDMFNHIMQSDTSSNLDLGDNSLLAATSVSANSSSSSVTGAGEGCSESLNLNEFSTKLQDLFDIIGFEVFKNSDKSFTIIDKCDILPQMSAVDLDDLMIVLKPYFDDCLIYPLQVATNNTFTNYKDWVNWYNDDNKKLFPKCALDISYCDLLANHIHECVID